MPKQVPCQTCGVPFAPRASGGKPQVRCSEKCRRKVANANFTKKNAPVKAITCSDCGAEIAHLDIGRPRKYCSDGCKQRATNRAQNRRRQPVSVQPDRDCECGRRFAPSRRDQTYCSPVCTRNASQRRRYRGEPLRQGVAFKKTCVECGSAFTAQKINAKWCSPICRIRTNSRDSSRRRGPVDPNRKPYADREIFERDGWRCHLCKKLVKRTVLRSHPDGATIDHIVPRSQGGADAPENVATAHLRCNLSKGVRAMNEQLRLI